MFVKLNHLHILTNVWSSAQVVAIVGKNIFGDTIAKRNFRAYHIFFISIKKRDSRIFYISRKHEDPEEEEENPGKYTKRPSIQDNQAFQRAVLNSIGSRASIRASVRASARSRRGENKDDVAWSVGVFVLYWTPLKIFYFNLGNWLSCGYKSKTGRIDIEDYVFGYFLSYINSITLSVNSDIKYDV